LADIGGMPGLDPSATLRQLLPPAAGTPAPAIFLPREHGSWSLVLEPLTLGLLVAPSSAGAALALAALAGFFARRPLKAALAPEFTARRRAARETVVMFSALAVAGLFETLVLGGATALWPLLLAAPLGGMFVHFDRQNESRAAAAELAGSATFALLPAVFATLAGWSWPTALALAALALARSVPTVLTVRTCLRLGKGQKPDIRRPVTAAAVALGLIGALASRRLVPGLSVGLVALLLLRTGFFVTALRPGWPAKRIGMIEAAIGALYVGITAFAYHSGSFFNDT